MFFFNNPLLPHETYFNLFARGVTVDLGAGLSLLVGVLTTQSYLSAFLMAKSLKVARAGALLGAFALCDYRRPRNFYRNVYEIKLSRH